MCRQEGMDQNYELKSRFMCTLVVNTHHSLTIPANSIRRIDIIMCHTKHTNY